MAVENLQLENADIALDIRKLKLDQDTKKAQIRSLDATKLDKHEFFKLRKENEKMARMINHLTKSIENLERHISEMKSKERARKIRRREKLAKMLSLRQFLECSDSDSDESDIPDIPLE